MEVALPTEGVRLMRLCKELFNADIVLFEVLAGRAYSCACQQTLAPLLDDMNLAFGLI